MRSCGAGAVLAMGVTRELHDAMRGMRGRGSASAHGVDERCRPTGGGSFPNTPFTIQLGYGVSIQLTNVVINTKNFGATIQFDSLQFYAATAKVVVVPVCSIDIEGPARRPHVTEVDASCVHPPTQRPQQAKIVAANKGPQKRTSIFGRLSQSGTLTLKRVIAEQKVSVVLPTPLPCQTNLSHLENMTLKLPHLEKVIKEAEKEVECKALNSTITAHQSINNPSHGARE
ncbi:hypothetical protein M5K25_023248 [Dendrobium thyrsiflorum]|uniref:Uncharacterized protein n=1 Tax=Dendrobium thyrsiflorum TaxID=117978 RepID=A0ABD0U7J8_DENTH